MEIVYSYKENLYVNLTNRCTARCIFCIKYKWKWQFRGHNLKLKKEPSAEEVLDKIKKHKKLKEVVFCGYGEPFLRFETLIAVSKELKKNKIPIRINTTGHGNLIYKRNVLPELAGLIDGISVSLNAHNKVLYNKLLRPKFGEETFDEVIDFIKKAKEYIPEVNISVIDIPEIDIEDCKKIAKKLNVGFLVRPYLELYESK